MRSVLRSVGVASDTGIQATVRHVPRAGRVPGPPRGPGPGSTPGRAPRNGWQRPELMIWGAHGGAATTTLAIWLQPAWDMGVMRPGPNPAYPVRTAQSCPLLIACRSTAIAARHATAAITAVTRQGGRVTALVVVGDGWPEPATATSRFRLLQPQAMAVVHFPFIPGLRLADDPTKVPLPRRARRALDQIQALIGRSPALGTQSSCRMKTAGGLSMLFIQALTVGSVAALHTATSAAGAPNPAPAAPPGLSGTVNTLLAWWKWGALIAGVFGLVGCGAMMAIGRRNRSNLAADGATGIPWVLAGLTLIALSSGIVGVFM